VSFFTTVLPLLSATLCFIFAVVLFLRFAKKRGLHVLVWGIGIVMYGLGGLSEALHGISGFNDFFFRIWYLFGAILVAAWLGQGTMYLLLRRKVAHVQTVLLVAASIYGGIRVFGAKLDPTLLTTSLHTGSELSGHAIVTDGVRLLTPFFNLYGTLALVGGAIWSAIIFFRKRVLLHRTLGNLLIATGALLPAFGGTFSRMGIPNALYISEFLGVLFLFAGFLRATTPMRSSKHGSDDL
jgi:hypothetical protein